MVVDRGLKLANLGAQNRPGLFIHAVVETDQGFRMALAALVLADAQGGPERGPYPSQIVEPDGSFVERFIIGDDAAAFSGGHHFGGLETEDSDVPHGAGVFALVACPNGLR